MDIRWDLTKNDNLKKRRGVSFEEIIQGKLVAVKEHPARKHQNSMLFELNPMASLMFPADKVREGRRP